MSDGRAVAAAARPSNCPSAGATSGRILGMRVEVLSPAEVVRTVIGWSRTAGSTSPLANGSIRASLSSARVVCAANVHMCVEAYDDDEFLAIINSADLIVPDGMPLVWALRTQGHSQAERVRVTPDLLLALFAAAEQENVSIGLYGGTDSTLTAFRERLRRQFPDLRCVYWHAPPLLSARPGRDDAEATKMIAAGVDILLVGIGCPKQERWMHVHRDALPCVMLGVGAAFDLFGGRTREAPRWMQRAGLEWLFRLAQEPRRLWRRYLRTNPRFMMLMARQLAAKRKAGRPRA